MAKIHQIEPLVEQALIYHPETRGDNFLLYIEVLRHFNVERLPLDYVFRNHKALRIPSLETITRCRRKLQEIDPSLRDEEADEIRRQEANAYYDYSKNKEREKE